MPWRNSRDPYLVWLSEIMLQQTQVASVIPYFERFTKQFPTVKSLAAAPLDDVLKLWAGLGYYSRARNLHRGAILVDAKFGGNFPDQLELAKSIPGIGDYTAGAILSIAFSKPEALVDGNVARVLARMFLLKGDWRGGEGKKNVWLAARTAVAEAAALRIDPGDFNQALMELGATVCTPRSPDCPRCPISKSCAAFREGRQSEFPQLKAKTAVTELNLRAWIVRGVDDKILFAQRPAAGLFGGLWELPTQSRAKLSKKFERKPIATIKQILTHRVLNIDAFEIDADLWKSLAPNQNEFEGWSGRYERYSWISIDDALKGSVALHASQLKILALYADNASLFD